MSDIFLSYAHEDQVRIKQLAEALEGQGWTVFWDRTIAAGNTWRSTIGMALETAGCVVVAWSEHSIHSHWVCEEAEDGQERHRLVPVFLDNVRPPLGFRSIHAANLAQWDGKPSAAEFMHLVSSIAQIIGPPKPKPEPPKPENADKLVPLPKGGKIEVKGVLGGALSNVGEVQDLTRSHPNVLRLMEALKGSQTSRLNSNTSSPEGETEPDTTPLKQPETPVSKPSVKEATTLVQPKPLKPGKQLRLTIWPVLAFVLIGLAGWWVFDGKKQINQPTQDKTPSVDNPKMEADAAKRQAEQQALAAEEKRKQADAESQRLEEANRKAAEAQQLAAEQVKAEQEAKQKAAEASKPLTVFQDKLKDGSLGPKMVWMPTGQFRMGDLTGKGDKDELPVHTVTISQPFAMGQTEVSFVEYDQFAKATQRNLPDDQQWGRGNRPVINVSWNDAVAYAQWLSEQTGKPYRLPTEAEWEYAARAGTETEYWWGNEIGNNRANCDGCGSPWDNKQTAPVGSFKPNAWGLYDTAGNVWEWVQDCWHDNYTKAPDNGATWQTVECGLRVLRGGSWIIYGGDVRSAYRGRSEPGDGGHNIGFRLALGQTSQ